MHALITDNARLSRRQRPHVVKGQMSAFVTRHYASVDRLTIYIHVVVETASAYP